MEEFGAEIGPVEKLAARLSPVSERRRRRVAFADTRRAAQQEASALWGFGGKELTCPVEGWSGGAGGERRRLQTRGNIQERGASCPGGGFGYGLLFLGRWRRIGDEVSVDPRKDGQKIGLVGGCWSQAWHECASPGGKLQDGLAWRNVLPVYVRTGLEVSVAVLGGRGRSETGLEALELTDGPCRPINSPSSGRATSDSISSVAWPGACTITLISGKSKRGSTSAGM